MSRSSALCPGFAQGGVVLLLGLVVLVGCGTPEGAPTGVGRAGVAVSPTLLRPGPGTPVGTPATPSGGAASQPVGTSGTMAVVPTVPQVANPALFALLRESR